MTIVRTLFKGLFIGGSLTLLILVVWVLPAFAAINLRMNGSLGLSAISSAGTTTDKNTVSTTTFTSFAEKLEVGFRGNVLHSRIGFFNIGFAAVSEQQELLPPMASIVSRQNNVLGYNVSFNIFPRTFIPFTFFASRYTNEGMFMNQKNSDLNSIVMARQEINFRKMPSMSLLYSRQETSAFSVTDPDSWRSSAMFTAKQETYDYKYLASYLRSDSQIRTNAPGGANIYNFNLNSEYFDPVLVSLSGTHANSGGPGTTGIGMNTYYSEDPSLVVNTNYQVESDLLSSSNRLGVVIGHIASPVWSNSLSLDYKVGLDKGVNHNASSIIYSTAYSLGWLSPTAGLYYKYADKGALENVSVGYNLGANHGGTLLYFIRYGVGYNYSSWQTTDLKSGAISSGHDQNISLSLATSYADAKGHSIKKMLWGTEFYATLNTRFSVGAKADNYRGVGLSGPQGLYSAATAGFTNSAYPNLYVTGQAASVLGDPSSPNTGMQSLIISGRYIVNRNISTSVSRNYVGMTTQAPEAITTYTGDAIYDFRLSKNLTMNLRGKLSKIDYDKQVNSSSLSLMGQSGFTFNFGRTNIGLNYAYEDISQITGGRTNNQTIALSVTRTF